MKYLKTFFSQEIKKFPITLRKITDFDYREDPHLYRKVNLKTLVDRELFDTGSPYFSFY